jgi:hypothetical protein
VNALKEKIRGEKAARGGGVESREGRGGGEGENGGWEKGELRVDPHAASSKRAHMAAGTVDNEEKELDGAGVVLAVVVHCKCFVEYETFFTSYLPASLYLVQLSVTFVTCSFIYR